MDYVRRDDENVAERGFTLVELLIVVVILGILAGIVVFAVGNLGQNAQSSACQTERQTLETAVEAYRANTNPPPALSTIDTWDPMVTAGVLRAAPDAAVWDIEDGVVSAVATGECNGF